MAAAVESAIAGTITLSQLDTYTILKVFEEGGTKPKLVSRSSDGKQFVLKLSDTMGGAQEANEYLAFQLYKAAGCRVPETFLVKDETTGAYGLLEEFIKGATLRELMDMHNPDINTSLQNKTFPAIQNDLVIHALLANWDINVMGNIMIPSTGEGSYDFAHPITLDCGGTLQFRAMGGIKPYMPKMTNIESIVSFAQNYKPMGKLKSMTRAELENKVCGRWKSVDKAAILAAFDVAAPKVRPIFEATGLRGLNIDEVRKVLVKRMEYLDALPCDKTSTTANAGGAGAGAGLASTGGGRRTHSKTRKQRRQHKKQTSMRQRRTMKK